MWDGAVFFLFCFELHAVMSELHMMSCKHEVSRCKGCCVILCYCEGWFSKKIQIQTAHRVLVSPGMQRAVNGLKKKRLFSSQAEINAGNKQCAVTLVDAVT